MANKLKLIPAEKAKSEGSVLEFSDPENAGIKASDTDEQWECGACGFVLIDGAERGNIEGIVLRCPCGAYNDATI